MKISKFILAALPALFLSCGGGVETESVLDPVKFEVKKGVNVSHWLSQNSCDDEFRKTIINKADFETIAAMGFDCVRLPLDEVVLYNTDGSHNQNNFALLDSALKWTEECNLNIICDLHIVRSYHFNSENDAPNTLFSDSVQQDKLVEIWKDLQSYLMSQSNQRVAYELLNEVCVEDPEQWNVLANRIIDTLRIKEPERTIILGSNMWQSPSTFKDLRVPENDKNIILAFHFYEPVALTHYKAAWAEYKWYEGGVQYPGDVMLDMSFKGCPENEVERLKSMAGVWDKERIVNAIKPALDASQKFGLRMVCGEFGCYPYYSDEKSRENYYRDLLDVFAQYNISYIHWTYKGDFPVVDSLNQPNMVGKILCGIE